MEKILILILCLLFYSCDRIMKTKPIEKYRGKGIIVIENPHYVNFGNNAYIRVKTKDSIFRIKLSTFDAKNLKSGDTIK